MSNKNNNKVLELAGLNCADCSNKIEREVGKLENIQNSTINFFNKTLTINIAENADAKNVLNNVTALINKIEPEVIVKEKSLSKYENKVLVATDLCCKDCSEKIRKEILNIDGVESVKIDFKAKKVFLGLNEEKDKNFEKILQDANTLSGKIVKSIKLFEETELDKTKKRREMTLFCFGIILFITGLFIKGSFYAVFPVFLAAYLLTGYNILYKAVRNLIDGRFLDENFLMSIATIGAFAVQQYPEGVAVMIFYKIGEFFQDRAVDSSRKSIKQLMDLKPDHANVKKGNSFEKVPPEDVKIGNLILVKPGERVPLDGIVNEGESTFDTKAITGEPVPRSVKNGDSVYSGFINEKSPIILEVTKDFAESTVSRILELVESAGAKKSKTENFITKFAKVYTPLIVSLAVIIAIIPPLVISGSTFSEWIYRAMIFLVISCPCALVISIPLGFFGGIGSASRKGILVKGSNYIEALNKVSTVVFDKTGTLTKGVFKVTKISPSENFTKEELLYLSAHAESFSDHPIATSIKNAFIDNLDINKVTKYKEVSGIGINCDIEGKQVLCGNGRLMKENGIKFLPPETPGTIVHVAVDRQYAGYLLISDEIKEDSRQAIARLKEIGVHKTIMLSGDNKEIANEVGKQLGLDEVIAELLPDQKVIELDRIEKDNKKYGKIIFVGDGINDAPVITRADIGIAMGGLGVDAAIESADVVIMNDSPAKIPEAINIAHRTRKIVTQNITFSLAIKVIVLSLGVLGMATMWEAVFADVGVALLAILNSSRV